jgi:hypothetical protein
MLMTSLDLDEDDEDEHHNKATPFYNTYIGLGIEKIFWS